MSNDPYYSPEKFGLTTIGEIDFSDGCYQFDLTVVWRNASGQLFYGDDSGCSCPSPFERQGLDDLTASSFADLQAHLEKRLAEDTYDEREKERCAGELVELMGRIRALHAIAAEQSSGGEVA